MSENPRAAQAAAQTQSRSATRWAVAAGGIVAAAVVAAGIALHTPSGPPRLEASSVTEDAALAVTLDPGAATQMLADAKACRMPLAHVQIWHAGGAPDEVVQVRSGTYLSPPFTLTTTPARIALPFPAAYAAGTGTISIVGHAQGVNVTLSPDIRFATVDGAAPINVVWATDKPCG